MSVRLLSLNPNRKLRIVVIAFTPVIEESKFQREIRKGSVILRRLKLQDD